MLQDDFEQRRFHLLTNTTTSKIRRSLVENNERTQINRVPSPVQHKQSLQPGSNKNLVAAAEDTNKIQHVIFDNHTEDQTPSLNVNELQLEIEKWKVFGKMMTDSYEQLNKRFNNFLSDIESTGITDSESSIQV